MSSPGCDLSSQIVKALQSDGIGESARQHLADCETCRNAVAADAFMKSVAAEPVEMRKLPDASLVWLKSQLLEQGRDIERMATSATLTQTGGFAVLAIAWAAVLTWNWDSLQALMRNAGGGNLVGLLSASHSFVPLLTTLVLLATATLALAAHSVLLEE